MISYYPKLFYIGIFFLYTVLGHPCFWDLLSYFVTCNFIYFTVVLPEVLPGLIIVVDHIAYFSQPFVLFLQTGPFLPAFYCLHLLGLMRTFLHLCRNCSHLSSYSSCHRTCLTKPTAAPTAGSTSSVL